MGSRKNIEKDELEKAREILKKPDLTLEQFIDMDLNKIKNLEPSKLNELKHLQNDLRKLHQADFDNAMKDADQRKELQNEEMDDVKDIMKDPKMTSNQFIDVNIDKLKLPEDRKNSLRRIQDELKDLHSQDLMDTMEDLDKRHQLEIKDLEAARKILKKPTLTLDQFLDLYIPAIKGLTDDQKKALIRLQEEEELMHKKDIQDAMEDDDKRQDLENKELDIVKQILGQNIS